MKGLKAAFDLNWGTDAACFPSLLQIPTRSFANGAALGLQIIKWAQNYRRRHLAAWLAVVLHTGIIICSWLRVRGVAKYGTHISYHDSTRVQNYRVCTCDVFVQCILGRFGVVRVS